MPLIEISEKDFYAHQVGEYDAIFWDGDEVKWFKESDYDILTIIIDISEWEYGVGHSIYEIEEFEEFGWVYVIFIKGKSQVFNYVTANAKFKSLADAELEMRSVVAKLCATGLLKEILYVDQGIVEPSAKTFLISTIDDEVKAYLKKNPAKIHELSPRRFEELVASILVDMGLDVSLTQATRDGGSDIIAQVKNSLTSIVILVECKKYAPDNRVGVKIVREVAGVHQLRKPAKSLIVTTSTFTKPAIEEAKQLQSQLDLKDYQNLKEWLSKY